MRLPTAAHEAPGPLVALPPSRPLDASLGALLAARSSCRQFSESPLALDELATILNAGYGIKGKAHMDGFQFDSRPVPSAGAKYPLEIRVLVRAVQDLDPGAYQYLPVPAALRRQGPAARLGATAELFLGQPYLSTAAALVVLVGSLDRTMARYGDRGYRYVLFEAGHVAQNMNLASGALSLGSLDLGGFYDDALADTLGLHPLEQTEQVPLYAVAVGRRLTDDADTARSATVVSP